MSYVELFSKYTNIHLYIKKIVGLELCTLVKNLFTSFQIIPYVYVDVHSFYST